MRTLNLLSEGDDNISYIQINDEAETLAARMGAALMREDGDHAMVLAQEFYDKAYAKGADAAQKNFIRAEDEENRRRAEFKHGKAEFRTRDGMSAFVTVHLERWNYWPRIWKRACHAESETIDFATPDMTTPIPIRTYEWRGQFNKHGLPVYHEME